MSEANDDDNTIQVTESMPPPDEGDPVLKAKLLEFAADFPFFQHMSFEVVDMRPGWAKVLVRLQDELRNPNGQIHGGVIASLIDMSITQAMLLTSSDSSTAVSRTRRSPKSWGCLRIRSRITCTTPCTN